MSHSASHHSHASHGHGDGHGHDSPEAIKKHVRLYIFIFIALLVGTVITVLASYVNLGHVGNIVLALIIASIKAFLVAGYFMHLTNEKRTIYAMLAATVFFFIGLMFLTIWSMSDYPHHTVVY